MSRWIEIPAHRILEVDAMKFFDIYQVVNAEGQPPQLGEMAYRVVRRSDGKVFKPAEFVPASGAQRACAYLQEV